MTSVCSPADNSNPRAWLTARSGAWCVATTSPSSGTRLSRCARTAAPTRAWWWCEGAPGEARARRRRFPARLIRRVRGDDIPQFWDKIEPMRTNGGADAGIMVA